MLAITLAKINIVISSILDRDDLESVWVEEPTDTPISEIFSFASLKVLHNVLHFVIKYNKVKMGCNNVTILHVGIP